MAPYSNSEKLVITPSKFDAMSSNLNTPLVEEYSFEAQPELLNVFQPASFGARWSFRSFIVVIQVNNRTQRGTVERRIQGHRRTDDLQ